MSLILSARNPARLRVLHNPDRAAGVLLDTRTLADVLKRTLVSCPDNAISIYTAQNGITPGSALCAMRAFLDVLAIGLGCTLLDWRIHHRDSAEIPSILHYDRHPGAITTCTNLYGQGTQYLRGLPAKVEEEIESWAREDISGLDEMRAVAKRQHDLVSDHKGVWQSVRPGMTLAFRSANRPHPLLHRAPEARRDSATLVGAFA